MAKWEQAEIIEGAKNKWEQAPIVSEPSPETVRPLQEQPEPTIAKPFEGGAPATGSGFGGGGIVDLSGAADLGVRGLKSFANILPETVKEVGYGVGGGKITSFIAAHKLNKKLKEQGIKAPSLRETQKLIKQKVLAGTKIPEFEVKPAETIGEKAVDITTGITKFVAKLALLKKAYPNISGGALWEMENLSSGGTPGMGYTMHGVFTAPGKVIKGAGIGAKAGKLGLESAGLAGVTALESKIDTGEIDWKEVAVSAALPLALRTPGVIKRLIKAKNPKVMKALVETHPELKTEIKGQPVTLETSNKAVQEWSVKAKQLSVTERKPAVKRLRKQQAARGREAYKKERAKGTPRLEAFKKARKAYGGRAAIPEIEPLKLTSEQEAIYGSRIERVYPETRGFQRTGAATAIEKMQLGKIPTNYEFGLLEPILGREATKELYTNLIKKRPFSGWEMPALVIQGFKTKFGLDIQMFRQGRSLAPRHPILYLKSSVTNARAYVNNKYAEKVFAEVKSSPGYSKAEKLGWNFVGEAGYASNRLEYYSLGLTERLLTSKNKVLRGWGRLLEASERGAVAGINTMQKGLYDNAAKHVRNLSLTPAQEKVWLKNRAKTHNTFMKILRVPPDTYKGQYKGLRKLQQVANYLLFSPSMTVSRPLSIKAMVANKGSRRYAGVIIASNIATIYATAAIPTIIGSQMRLQNPNEEPDVNGELNVLDGQWGKIRYGNEVFDFSGGDAPFYRTIARIGVSAYMYGKEKVTGKSLTEIAGKRIPDAGTTIERYVSTRETAALGYAQTMLTGKDWMGEPIPRFEATIRAISPEVIEATIEAGMADGLWASLATMAATSTSVGVSTYPVKASATRSKFKDIIANVKHKQNWDELSLPEQRKLQSKHRKQFDVLDEKVRKERLAKPYSIERIKEQEIQAGKHITNMLSKENKGLVEDVSLGISRRPKNMYLNDNRYNRYQELVAQFVDERLSKIDFTKVDEKRRIKRVQLIVRGAKNKAFTTLRREMNVR